MQVIISDHIKKSLKILPESIQRVIPAFIEIGLLLLVFLILNTWIRSFTELPAIQFQDSILAERGDQFFSPHLWMILPAVAVIAVLIIGRNKLLIPWTAIPQGSNLRLLIGVAVGLLTWAHVSYPFHYFMDEYIVVERLIAVLVAVLVFWRPIFVLPYLLMPLLLHYGEPVKINNWSITEMPIRVIILFASQLFLWLARGEKKWNNAPFVFLILCIIAGNYFPSGYAKLKNGWLASDHVYFLLPSMYTDGWMGFLNHQQVSKVIEFLSGYNMLYKVGTLMVEFGCLLILWRRETRLFFLAGFITLHSLIFMVSGILFWPWITIEGLLLWMFWKKKPISNIANGFTIWHFILSLVLIGSATKWLHPSVYLWQDSRANYTYLFEAELTDGSTRNIPSQYFWPQYFEFAWSNYHYLHEKPTLEISWGTIANKEVADKMVMSSTGEEILSLEKEYGITLYDAEKAQELKNYLQHYIGHGGLAVSSNPWRRFLSAPPQRLTFIPDNAFSRGDPPVEKVNVIQVLSFFSGETYQEIRREKVSTIEIPSQD